MINPIRLLLICLCCCTACYAEGNWLTVNYKRSSLIDASQAKYVGGVGAELRVPLSIPVDTSRARFWFRHSRTLDLHLTSCNLLSEAGSDGPAVTFSGATSLSLAADSSAGTLCSDVLETNLSAGRYAITQVYADLVYPYVNDVDGCPYLPPNAEEGAELKWLNHRPGACVRVDVWCETPTTSVVCYGDSITQGHGSTVGAGARYTDSLATLLGRPTVNLGVNGSLFQYSDPMSDIAECEGVEAVVFLMGINDINWERMDLAKYQQLTTDLVADCTDAGLPIYMGTMTPAVGYTNFDDDKEELRQAINAWIRENSFGATDIIDFDAALRDPDQTDRMRSDLHCGDWLHPNDDGYALMADAAAAVLVPEPATLSLIGASVLTLLRRRRSGR